MKRKELISKLVKEGITEKTLVNMTDKQLRMLAERLLSEQYATTSTVTSTTPGNASVVNIPKEKAQDIAAAKSKKQTFVTYEGEVKEQEKLGAEKKEYSDKEKAIKAANAKIKAAIKDGKDYGDYTKLIKKLCNGKLPESTQKIIDDKKDLNEWVDKVVKKNIVPFTSKKEIMELIDIKLTEQHIMEPDIRMDPDPPTEDEEWGNEKERRDREEFERWKKLKGIPIPGKNRASSPDIEIEKPEVVPQTPETLPDIDPDDPFRDPFPDTIPRPKAKGKEHISAREAKDKIIDLMKQMLQ